MTNDTPDFPILTQKTLFQRLDERLFEPEVRRGESGMLVIWGKRDDDVEPGTIDRVHAAWYPDGTVGCLIRRRGEYLATPVGYTELAAELKTGVQAETGESRVRSILRALFSHDEKTTKAEQAAERRDKAVIAAAKKAAAEAVKAQRAAAREAKAAAKTVAPGLGEDVSA